MGKACRPHYPLNTVKAAFSSASLLNRTLSALNGAEELGMDEQAVVDVIATLGSSDFEKSMRSVTDASVWQDVYKPVIGGRELYVKFSKDAHRALLLISFKENLP